MAAIQEINICDIETSDNIRGPGWEKSVSSMVASIKVQGLIQPILVSVLPQTNGDPVKYKLLVGNRRLAACKELGKQKILASIKPVNETPNDKEELLLKVTENTERQELTPLEEAQVYLALTAKNLKAKDIAQMIGKTEGYISQRLSLLRLPQSIQESLEKGNITPTHARELSRVKDEKKQERLLDKAECQSPDKFRETVKSILDPNQDEQAGAPDKPGKVDKSGKKAEKAAGVRPKAEVTIALNKMFKLKVAAEKDKDEKREAYTKGIIKGILWATYAKNAKLPEA
jgi:ParB family chromosome partitioning protein